MKIEQPRLKPLVNFKINIVKKEKIMKYCQNCGHDCHCGGDCMKNYDGNGEIKCCGYCRHEEKEEKITNNEDLFNGA